MFTFYFLTSIPSNVLSEFLAITRVKTDFYQLSNFVYRFFFGPAHGKWAEPIYAGYSPQVCARFIRTDCQPDKIRVRFSFLVSLAVFLPDHQFNFCHNFFSYLFTSSLLSNARPPHTRGLLATFRSCPAIY